jgi:hypothetical protein
MARSDLLLTLVRAGIAGDVTNDLRRWGPKDRITEEDACFIADQASHDPKANVRVEIELVFEVRKKQADEERQRTEAALTANSASVAHRSRIEAIAYDALLVDISYAAAKALVDRDAKTIAGIPDLYAIRPRVWSTFMRMQRGPRLLLMLTLRRRNRQSRPLSTRCLYRTIQSTPNI